MEYKKIIDSTKFYFGKQEDYSKYRPSYPKELFEFLTKTYNLKSKDIVELGAGTGKFSKSASSYCNKIYYVEPNLDMITKGKEYCNDCNNIIFVNNSAENTTLHNDIADIVFAVQSFHWFDKTTVKEEVKRILKPNGYFAIVWNDWEDENNEFSKSYFKYISECNTKLTGRKYQHKNVDDRKNFFKEGMYDTYTFIHSKEYSLEMLIGLSKSLSYAPKEDDIYYDEFVKGIIDIFNKYQNDDYVRFDFHTEMYIGKV
ncbi:MAG: class I SAM-dependent methyltransferase [Bacilli bacterium]